MTNASFTADTPAKVDLFKRRPFAVSLAKSLCLKKDMQGLVIGIEGEWGAGKTSIINFIKSELSNSASKPIVIEFNPWMTSGSKDLVEIMLMQLASALGASSNTKNGMRTAETLVQYAGLLKYLKYLPALSWAGNIAEDATGVASNAIKSIKELVPNLDLAKSKTTVEKALRTLNKPIIVIIDDIDRLTHSEIRHLFQAIKAVADFPRVTYLLAYDLDQITSALDEEYGQNKGQSYIEKIIQISYPIPVIMPLQMMAYTRNKMDDLLSRLAINLKPYERNYWEKALSLIVGLQKTPRDLVRLTNRLVIVIPNTHGEINICDVVVLEAISLKFPSIRSVVHQNPELFTGRRWINDESGSDVDWSQFIGENKDKNKQKWMEILPSKESDNKTVSKALKFLFPRLTSDSLNENNLDELRISASNRLQRYFALTTLEDSVDVKEIHNLLNNQELLENYLDFNPETIDRLLSDIENYIGSAEISDINTVADILIKKATSLVKNNELTHASLRSLNSIFIALINKLSPTEKNNLFIKLIERSPLSISEGILRYAISDLGLWGRNGERESENPIIADKETVIDGKNYWVSRISEEIKQPDFLNNISASSLVWCWWHLAENKTAVVDTLKAFFVNDATTALAAKRFLDRNGFPHFEDFILIWNLTELKEILLKDPRLASEYNVFIKQLSQPDLLEWFNQREIKQ